MFITLTDFPHFFWLDVIKMEKDSTIIETDATPPPAPTLTTAPPTGHMEQTHPVHLVVNFLCLILNIKHIC